MPQRHKVTKETMRSSPLPEHVERIASKIVDAAYTVHKALGPGLLERVYEVCLRHELSKRGLRYERQGMFQLILTGFSLRKGCVWMSLLKIFIICELKSRG